MWHGSSHMLLLEASMPVCVRTRQAATCAAPPLKAWASGSALLYLKDAVQARSPKVALLAR